MQWGGHAVMLALMLALLVLCIVYRDKLTADEIARLTPGNQLAAALLMLILFGVKSFCIFIYCGILYAACGMIFSLPVALVVNLCGTVVMTSIPYWIGRRAGGGAVKWLTEKYPKLEFLNEMQEENSFFLSFIIRVAGLLPSDVVSAFFGAGAMSYDKYIVSTVLGFLPMIGTFTVMGMSVHDVTSPGFIISVGIEVVIMIFSCVFYGLVRKKKKKSAAGQESSPG